MNEYRRREDMKPEQYWSSAEVVAWARHGFVAHLLDTTKWMTIEKVNDAVCDYARQMKEPKTLKLRDVMEALEALVEYQFVWRRDNGDGRLTCTPTRPYIVSEATRSEHPAAVEVDSDCDCHANYECPICGLKFRVELPD